MLFVCVFSALTIWYWIITNCCALPPGKVVILSIHPYLSLSIPPSPPCSAYPSNSFTHICVHTPSNSCIFSIHFFKFHKIKQSRYDIDLTSWSQSSVQIEKVRPRIESSHWIKRCLRTTRKCRIGLVQPQKLQVMRGYVYSSAPWT